MALKIYIVKGVCANAIHMFDTMFGIENKTMVLTLPIAEDTQPPPNEPIMKPITYEVAKEIIELFIDFQFQLKCVLLRIHEASSKVVEISPVPPCSREYIIVDARPLVMPAARKLSEATTESIT